MTTAQIMAELEAMGSESCKRIFKNHGAPEPLFGVKVQDLKVLQKKLKKNHQLSLELYATGNSDAQYLAGLIADEKMISADDLRTWAKNATWYMLSEYTVAWVAAESEHGWTLAKEWIDAPEPKLQSTGWATLASLLTIKPDSALDLPWLQSLLNRVGSTIHQSANRVRYTLNGFVIACGCSVMPLSDAALEMARQMGAVSVEMGGTACKVPLAVDYIQKCREKGNVGRKKKMARC